MLTKKITSLYQKRTLTRCNSSVVPPRDLETWSVWLVIYLIYLALFSLKSFLKCLIN